MRNVSAFLTVVFLLLVIPAAGQQWYIKGSVKDVKDNIDLTGAIVTLYDSTHTVITSTVTDSLGFFSIFPVARGVYDISFSHIGFDEYRKKIQVKSNNLNLGFIEMIARDNVLDEVKVIEKILSVLQKGDTTEFNAAAFKVNPDADAAALVRKMPSIDVRDKQVRAQGETVLKVLVDGKPFFGDNPYASLNNLPANLIDKVQVYSEKSEQDLFTGFNGGNTTKTINIITKADRRNEKFGKVYAGYGGDNRYVAGGTMNDFGDKERITVTAQSNNLNIQNFSESNLVSTPGLLSGGTGVSNAAGINYTAQVNKKVDFSGSYFFNQGNNTVISSLTRQSILKATAGQIYRDSNNAQNKNYNHRLDLRLNYTIDSQNSILWQPQLSVQENSSNSFREGNTAQGPEFLNLTINRTVANLSGYNFINNLLYRHSFDKKGRTFSLDGTIANNGNSGKTQLNAGNTYINDLAAKDTFNQHIGQLQRTWTLTGNAVYTEPVGKAGLVQLKYYVNYIPSSSARNANNYDSASRDYTIPDTILSNTFKSTAATHKAGVSYQLQGEKYQFSAGIYYQLAQIRNTQVLPTASHIKQDFQNVLPAAHFQYRFSQMKNLNVTYNTSTDAPTVSQLQPVVNNTNPLFLTAGNPDLKQPYINNLNIDYSVTNINTSASFYLGVSGTYGMRYITNNVFLTSVDTTILHDIQLRKGVQLTTPVNLDGYKNATAYAVYSFPISGIKLNFDVDLNAGISQMPNIVNNVTNISTNKNADFGVSLNSNISEQVDFTLTANSTVIANENLLNARLNNTFFNQSVRFTLNLLLWKGFVFNTDIAYQYNSGVSGIYHPEYTLWNVGIGKKLLKDKRGDIRLVVYDILNQNTNIQHTVTDYYIQDTHNNAVNRYFVFTFTYNIRGIK